MGRQLVGNKPRPLSTALVPHAKPSTAPASKAEADSKDSKRPNKPKPQVSLAVPLSEAEMALSVGLPSPGPNLHAGLFRKRTIREARAARGLL